MSKIIKTRIKTIFYSILLTINFTRILFFKIKLFIFENNIIGQLNHFPTFTKMNSSN